MPKVSIIVPIYNVEKYLKECADSILAQTFTGFECILVDDGSPDKCGAICDEYAKKDSRIKVIHKENGGLGSARNAGIDVAQGEYFYFLDSDDLLHPQTIELLYTMARNEGADMTLCHYDFFDGAYDKDKPIDIEEQSKIFEEFDKEEILQNYHLHYGRVSLVSMCMKLYHRNIFNGYRIPNVRLHEDSLALPYTLERANKIIKTNYVLYHWRNTPGSLSRSKFNVKDFQWITIAYSNAEFFIKRKNKKQARFFVREFLKRTLEYYYKIPQDNAEEFYEAFKPYRKLYRKKFLSTGL